MSGIQHIYYRVACIDFFISRKNLMTKKQQQQLKDDLTNEVISMLYEILDISFVFQASIPSASKKYIKQIIWDLMCIFVIVVGSFPFYRKAQIEM